MKKLVLVVLAACLLGAAAPRILDIMSQGRINFWNSTNTYRVSLQAPDTLAVDQTLKFPPAAASAGQYLKNDGSGNLSWATGTTATDLDTAYHGGSAILADGGPVTINGTGGLRLKGPVPWADPVAYGADPTGATDSTAAINLAIQAAQTGGEVRIPPGTYKLTGDLSLTFSNLRIFGIGWPILKQYDTDHYHFAIGAGVKNIEICGVQFTSDTVSGGSGSAIEINAGHSTICEKIWIHHCIFGPTLNMIGVGGWGASSVRINSNHFALGAGGQHGIYIVDMLDVSVSENRITGPGAGAPTFPGADGIKFIGCDGVNCSGNQISSWLDSAIQIDQQEGTLAPGRLVVSHNRIQSCRVGIAAGAVTDLKIAGNQFDAITEFGVIASGTDTEITENTFRECGTAVDETCIEVAGTDATVDANLIAGNFQYGVKAGTIAGTLTVRSNTVLGTAAAYGFYFTGGCTATGIVTGNTVTGATTFTNASAANFVVQGNRGSAGKIAEGPIAVTCGTGVAAMVTQNADAEAFWASVAGGSHPVFRASNAGTGPDWQGSAGNSKIWKDGSAEFGDIQATGGMRRDVQGFSLPGVIGNSGPTEMNFSGCALRKTWIAPRAGSIMTLLARTNFDVTVGTVTAEIFKNGVTTGITAVLSTTDPSFKITHKAKDDKPFAEGDALSVKITSVNLGLSTEINVELEVEC